jgi:hypothetical protein
MTVDRRGSRTKLDHQPSVSRCIEWQALNIVDNADLSTVNGWEPHACVENRKFISGC